MMKHLILISMLILIMTACNSTTVTDDIPAEPTTSTQEEDNEVTAPEESSGQLELTSAQLAEFDGKDGQPAYIAVDGIIYDVTDAGPWSNGSHNGFEAGQDLTEPLNTQSPHGPSKLGNVPAIGVLIESPESSESALPEPSADEVAKDSEPTEEIEQETEVIKNTPGNSEETVSESTEEKAAIEDKAPVTIEKEITDADGNGLLEFTLEQLLAFDGLNGQPAYFAYKDLIYDVSHILDWAGGEHNGNKAGYDLTDDLAYAPHGEEKLKKATIVGELVK